MRQRTGLLGALLALGVSSVMAGPSFAEPVDLLRSIPLEVKDYAPAQSFPATFTTAEQVIQAINSSPVLIVHMEALRRGYHDLPVTEQEKLLTALHKRRLTNENDLMLGFDHGYAQLVYKQNKTGLFFLRKANDKFRTQFSNLAYGMAQAEADINLEASSPDIMTTRKMDATYNLSDAVKKDAEAHQPGFWPSYIQVIEKLKAMPAYQSFSRRDFSLVYVPYGNSVMPMKTAETTELPLTASAPSISDIAMPMSMLSGTVTATCNVDGSVTVDNATVQPLSSMVAQRSATFNGTMHLIQFLSTSQEKLYHVRVMGKNSTPLLTFNTYASPNIVEDIDGDGTLEIVARQYQANPKEPVIVYRYTPCGFERDEKIYQSFR